MTDKELLMGWRIHRMYQLIEMAGQIASLAKFLEHGCDAAMLRPVIATSTPIELKSPVEGYLEVPLGGEMDMHSLAQACESMHQVIERMAMERIEQEKGKP